MRERIVPSPIGEEEHGKLNRDHDIFHSIYHLKLANKNVINTLLRDLSLGKNSQGLVWLGGVTKEGKEK